MSYKNIMAKRQLHDTDSVAPVTAPDKPGLFSVHQTPDPYRAKRSHDITANSVTITTIHSAQGARLRLRVPDRA